VGVEQNDLTELIVRKAQANGSTPEQELQHMMDHNHMNAWMQEVRRNKALGLLLAEATVTDENGAPVDVSVAADEPEDADAPDDVTDTEGADAVESDEVSDQV